MANATVGSLRAVLEADVSQFNASMSGASSSAKKWADSFTANMASVKFEGEAFTKSLERNLSAVLRLAKEFSGANTAKSADEYAVAVERVGGASRLTAAEQAKVNAVMTEALAKYKALGLEAPAHIQKLADATKRVATETTGFRTILSKSFGSISSLAGTFGIGLGAGALLEMAKQAIESGSRVNDLSEKLGVSTTKVQQWSYALTQTGGSMENVDKSLSFLNKTLGKGEQGTIDLLDGMGLSLSKLRGQKSEDSFEQIVAAIARMANPLDQARAAVALFGKEGQNLLPSIREGFLDIAAQADVMSERTIKAMDRAGDEIDRLKHRMEVQGTEAFGDVAAFFNRQADLARLLAALKAKPENQASALGVPKRITVPVDGKDVALNDLTNAQLAAQIQVLDAIEKADQKYQEQHDKTNTSVAAGNKIIDYFTKAQLAAAGGAHELTTAEKEAEAERIKAQEAAAKAAEAQRRQLEQLGLVTKGGVNEALAEYDGLIHRAVAEGIPLDSVLLALIPNYRKLSEEAVRSGVGIDASNAAMVRASGAAARLLASLNLPQVSTDVTQLLSNMRSISIGTWAETESRLVAAAFKDLRVTTQAELDRAVEVAQHDFDLITAAANSGAEDVARALEKLQAARDAAHPPTEDPGKIFGLPTIEDMQKRAHALEDAYAEMLAKGGHTPEQLRIAWERVKQAEKDAGGEAETLGEKLHAIGLKIPQMLADGFKSGNVGAAIGQVADTLGKTLGTALGEHIAGPLGGAIFGALGSLVSMIGGLFSDHGRGKVVDFAQTFGGFEQLHAKLATLGADGEKFWIQLTQNTHSDDDALKTIGEINAALQNASKAAGEMKQAVAMKHVTDALAGNGLWDQFTKNAIAAGKVGDQVIDGLADAMARQLGKIGSGTAGVTGGLASGLGTAFEHLTGMTEAEADDALKQLQDLQARAAKGPLSEDDTATLHALERQVELSKAAAAHIAADSQEEFDRVSRIALASFNTYRAQGKSTVEAVQAIGPAIDDLAAAAGRFGFAGSVAYDQLSRWRKLTTDNAPLLDEISGLNDLLTASANLGTLTAESFTDLETQGESAYGKLIDAGFTQQESLVQMAPMLQTLIKLHNERGLAIDDETQSMIDQAHEQGLLQDDQLSTNDILQDGLGRIIELLGGDLPDAWKKFGDHAGEAFDDATREARDLHDALAKLGEGVAIPLGFVASGGADLPLPQMPQLPGFATGTGGRYLDFGAGTPVMLHGQERVMTKGEGEGGGAPLFVNLDGKTVARILLPHHAMAVRERGLTRG